MANLGAMAMSPELTGLPQQPTMMGMAGPSAPAFGAMQPVPGMSPYGMQAMPTPQMMQSPYGMPVGQMMQGPSGMPGMVPSPYGMQAQTPYGMQAQSPYGPQPQYVPGRPAGMPAQASGPAIALPMSGVQGAPGYPAAAGMPMPAAAAHGVLGAEGVKPPSTIKTVLKSALVFGGLGAALGAGATLLPFIPGGPLLGAAVGGVAGALVGVVRGLRKANQQKEQVAAMMQGPVMPPADPAALGPQVPVAPAERARARRKAAARRGARHTVRSGDTLGRIARKHDVSVKQLHDANRSLIGPNPNRLKVGTKLVVPRAKD